MPKTRVAFRGAEYKRVHIVRVQMLEQCEVRLDSAHQQVDCAGREIRLGHIGRGHKEIALPHRGKLKGLMALLVSVESLPRPCRLRQVVCDAAKVEGICAQLGGLLMRQGVAAASHEPNAVGPHAHARASVNRGATERRGFNT